MLLPVVAGVDGSDASLAAAEWAAREAVRRDRPLRLVHARHPRQRNVPAAEDRLRPDRSVLRHAEDRIRRTTPAVRLTPTPAEGPAAEALLREAGEAELLVLGSRGLSGFTGFLVGSVALGVVARCARPVVLVRAGEEPEDEHWPAADGSASAVTGYRDVVLGVDLTAPCDEVIDFAFEAAQVRGARLRAVHAWQPPSPIGLGDGEIALIPEFAQAEEWHGFLSAVLRPWREKYPDVEVAETVTRGRPQSVLVRAGSGAGLLVVGRRLTDRPAGPRTGPVTHAVVHHVGCPVAVVPHE
ncbi:universal stress protein [Streptomyces griseosporeus]|uniref:universal stress protein n=1 Tax=Streptomyces griseosporeus TaxID=1910 RepID=UPI0036FFD277